MQNASRGICVYCLVERDDLTIDHVIPRSWYPSGGHPDKPKWTVPCCAACNNRYSKIEKNLLERLGLCLDPNNAAVGDIARKATRAHQRSRARNKRDGERRALKRDRIRADMYRMDGGSVKGVLPFFGPSDGVMPPNPATVAVSEHELKEFGCKLARGMVYVIDRRLIGPDYRVECHINTEDADQTIFRPLYAKFGKEYQVATGVAAYMISHKSPAIYLLRFEFWSKLVLHATVIPSGCDL